MVVKSETVFTPEEFLKITTGKKHNVNKKCPSVDIINILDKTFGSYALTDYDLSDVEYIVEHNCEVVLVDCSGIDEFNHSFSEFRWFETPENFELMLEKYYFEKNMETIFNQSIDSLRTHHYWYGGTVATIKCPNGWKAEIAAVGDMKVEYAPNNIYETSLKDKSNGGYFYEEFHKYLPDDKSLTEAINSGDLIIFDGNWWEVFIYDEKNEYFETNWYLDAYSIFNAIEEAKRNLYETIKNCED